MANATSVSWTGASTTGQPATQGMMQADGFFSPVTIGSPTGTDGAPSAGPAKFPYGVASSIVGPTAVYNTNAATAGTTLTAANITGGNPVYLSMTGTLTGAANAQLPTVAALIAALPGVTVGTSYTLTIINASAGAFAWTVTTNAGSGTWTLTGTMSIAQNTTRTFVVTVTSVTTGALTATIASVGTGTYS